MSLASLCKVSTATILRVGSTADSTAGQVRTYSTANRGSLPTTSVGRLQPTSARRRFTFAQHDMQIDAQFFTVTNPQCDNRDQLSVGGVLYFVQGQQNPDLIGAFYRLDLKVVTNNLQNN